jgi:CPA2 family monovalent cation:H+ antiporter-2
MFAARLPIPEWTGSPVSDSLFEEVRMEAVKVPAWSRAAGRTLAELSPAKNHGVQIAGVNRGGMRILNPTALETLRVGDDVLALGGPAQIAEFKSWVREAVEDTPLEDVKAD